LLNIQKDELIHSFIFRMHIINGVTSFDNIISKDGRWTCHPRVKAEAVKILESSYEIDIYKSLCSINLSRNETNPLQNAKNNYGYLRYFYALERKTYIPTHRCLKIRLCEECIKEAIIERGFGYFLSDWYRANYCTKHHIALTEIELNDRAGAVRLISSVLSGDKINSSSQALAKINLRVEHIKSVSRNQTIGTRKPIIFIAPCSVKIMLRFVLKQRIAAMNGELTSGQAENIRKNIEAKTRIKGIVEGRLFHFLINHDFRGFKRHWEKSTEHTQVDYGIFTKEKLVETIIKDKKSACEYCDLECDYAPFVSTNGHSSFEQA
jgi:uncharacterized protein (UPF0248 family)